MNRFLLFILLSGVLLPAAYSQHVGIKTNVFMVGTASPNLGLELGLSKKLSISLEGSYNPFAFGADKFWKHWFVQPELRWWYCHQHAGSFWGLHSFYGQYNIISPQIGIKHRYEGNVAGAGLSYGYSWILGNRWNLEAVVGGGYARLNYDKFECGDCGEKIGAYHRNYFGPTKAALSLIYYIK